MLLLTTSLTLSRPWRASTVASSTGVRSASTTRTSAAVDAVDAEAVAEATAEAVAVAEAAEAAGKTAAATGVIALKAAAQHDS